MIITAVDGRPCYLNTNFAVYMEELRLWVDLVGRTREAQKAYLRSNGCYPYLLAAKKLETELDERIDDYKKGLGRVKL